MIRELIELGVSYAQGNSGEILLHSGECLVFTGTLKSINRETTKKRWEAKGGRVLGSISNKVNYLVLGENPGSKLEKAKKLKIPILPEEEFVKLLS